MRIELTSYDAIELTSEELIQSIHNNVFGECVNDNDYIVSGVIMVLKNRLADPHKWSWICYRLHQLEHHHNRLWLLRHANNRE